MINTENMIVDMTVEMTVEEIKKKITKNTGTIVDSSKGLVYTFPNIYIKIDIFQNPRHTLPLIFKNVTNNSTGPGRSLGFTVKLLIINSLNCFETPHFSGKLGVYCS